MMRKLLIKMKRNNAAALPSVLVVSAILITLVMSLLNISAQQYKVTKSNRNMDYAYMGSSSIIEKAFDLVQGYAQKGIATYTTVNYINDEQYAADVVENMIKPEIISGINNNTDQTKREINVDNTGLNNAEGEILEVTYIPGSAQPVSGSSNKLEIRIGILAKAAYKRGAYITDNSKVYGEEKFIIEKPTKGGFKPAAVNGIGDLFVSKYMKSIIKGDVKIVGTSPQKARQMEQYYYGGIYTKNNADLTIDGNAYVRSFIRSGEYDQTGPDNSSIKIKGNAVAQSIQIFGENDKLLVYKDAFTFDDLELNGLNSVIAINRHYFGLSNGVVTDDHGNPVKYELHDASSAVVNSAVVHHPDEGSLDKAKKSKIVINGNVFINGGTYRVNPLTGEVLFKNILDASGNTIYEGSPQIEDASTAWNNSDEMPTYKNFTFEPGVIGPVYHSFNIDRSNDWIVQQAKAGNAKGYGNLFQYWDTQDDADVENWFNNQVKTAMEKGYSNITGVKSKIFGYCSYEMAANGTMYFMNKDADQEDDSQVKRDKVDRKVLKSENDYKKAHYYTDNSINWPDWVYEWNNAMDDSWDNYLNRTSALLENLKDPFIAVTADFVSRRYDWANLNINNTINKINGVTKFEKIGDELANLNTGPYDCVITTSEISAMPVNSNGYCPINSGLDLDKYYVIVNQDPTITLEIDGEMRGIVYTTGKVVLSPGAYLYGFVIAAGRGIDNNRSAADPGNFPQILENGEYEDKLKNGDFAAIEFRGSDDIGDINKTAVIDFTDPSNPGDPEAAKNYLISQFTDSYVKGKLAQIFN
jgi:hypothetical protein